MVLCHENIVLDARFSPDGKAIVTASADNTANLWQTEAMPGRPKAVTASCQFLTGLTIDETEAVRTLSADESNALKPIIDADPDLSRLHE